MQQTPLLIPEGRAPRSFLVTSTVQSLVFFSIFAAALRWLWRAPFPSPFRIFVPYDVVRQKTDWLTRWGLTGQWAVTTGICGTSYAIIWPLETLKNMGQVSSRSPWGQKGEGRGVMGCVDNW